MIPIADDNPKSNVPIATYAIALACVGVFVYMFSRGSENAILALFFEYGFVPQRFFGNDPFTNIEAWTTVFTSMFMHGDVLHIAFNMVYLIVFSDNVEDVMGTFNFVLFYLLCGIAAALTQAFVAPESTIPMVGASGAISGVLGAYLLLYPYATIRILLFIVILRVPAIVLLTFYIVMQVVSGVTVPLDEPGVAYWAHIGGFVAGVVLHFLFADRSKIYG